MIKIVDKKKLQEKKVKAIKNSIKKSLQESMNKIELKRKMRDLIEEKKQKYFLENMQTGLSECIIDFYNKNHYGASDSEVEIIAGLLAKEIDAELMQAILKISDNFSDSRMFIKVFYEMLIKSIQSSFKKNN